MSAATAPVGPLSQRSRLVRQVIRDIAYCLTVFPVALAALVVLITLLALGAGLAVLFIGLPILVIMLYVARGFADIQRLLLSYVLQRPVQRPRYRSREGRRGLRWLVTPMADPQSWLDLWHGIFGFIPATVVSTTVAFWWLVGLGYSLYFVWGWSLPPNLFIPGEIVWAVGSLPHTFLFVAIITAIAGLVLLVTAPFVTWGMTQMNVAITRMMLTPERVTALQRQIEDLTESRDAATTAEMTALRRLERDIHDGPQQRLIRVGMDLDLAQRRLRTDPEAARPLVAEAISQTRETLGELRALSRGIAPPILADRGLSAAITALAGRSTVPVELDIWLPGDVRLPGTVESTAYFIVAESLTNVAKHSGATRCQVAVKQEGALLRVSIFDDGGGGAHAAKGHGLAGLGDRVRAVGGRFHLMSPPGGPTELAAELPCG
jgi:signal transduction histidine kinase